MVELKKAGTIKRRAIKQNTKLSNADTVEPEKVYTVELEKAGIIKERANQTF